MSVSDTAFIWFSTWVAVSGAGAALAIANVADNTAAMVGRSMIPSKCLLFEI
jgi:hypothetical protein